MSLIYLEKSVKTVLQGLCIYENEQQFTLVQSL